MTKMVADQAAPQLLGVTAIKPVERHGLEAVKWFFYDKNTGAIMGRTAQSWALIIIFYIIYYACLAAFWAVMFTIFWQISIDLEKPRWTKDSSLIGTSPAMGVRPKQSDKLLGSSMIIYRKDKHNVTDVEDATISGYQEWEDRAAEFLKEYPLESKEIYFGQNSLKARDARTGKSKGCGINNMGFKEGKPCILLKLNKIYDLEPDYYNDTSLNITEKVSGVVHYPPKQLKDHINTLENTNQVWVSCKGEWPFDEESMGDIEYYPKDQGFPNQYFPYQNQKNYKSPLVAVKFKNPPIGQLLHIECRAWAHNINYDRMTNIGKAHFELLVHDSTTANAVENSR